MYHGDKSGTISITIFAVLSDDVDSMVNAWIDAIDQLDDLDCTIKVIDISANPEEMERHDIVFSPTTCVVFPDGREVRLAGYTNVVPSLVRAFQMHRGASQMHQVAVDFSQQNETLLADLQTMRAELAAMRAKLRESQE